MRFTDVLALLPLSAAALNVPHPQLFFSNFLDNSEKEVTPNTFPTVHESAVQARRILSLEKIGTLSTIFPQSNTPHNAERRPHDVSGTPIGLMDYYSDCEPATGNPTILAISIATSFKNVDAGSNITLSLRWHRPDNRPVSAAGLPRFSLVGYLEEIDTEDVIKQNVPGCFVKHHPDAAWWLPGNKIHTSKWVRLVVQEVYWIGGFGDRAYIGWIPIEDWQSVTKEEIESIRLPGEKSGGWKSWLGIDRPEKKEAFEL
ncbi:hypothetical protein BU24DRAFT_420488 [Aaosphaeria arxii CBS 175.79]|uniref:CREG-like beta-barrel domain-containing protein n=1 Tax=Aaosphaeria arxii CBS 175.79 TaxID=1450172 RepID=A0A6A5XXS2_9PLEO|nr:uncharacterized protein BU24DRAFT_420488 [Aaosphaeria arxii CBS 175.79]KAF2017440.1 hypothetical protein BU24DRAFT_420488 [Aaosphaeria arxii CBS 175.79]